MKDQVAIQFEPSESPIEFLLVFVTSKIEINKYTEKLASLLEGDAILWFAYPKRSSKKYDSDITRDDGWQILGKLGFEGVRMVAIDDDWSALRLRKAEYIKTMKRDPKRAMSKTGSNKSKHT
jgi:hypothetical protein